VRVEGAGRVALEDHVAVLYRWDDDLIRSVGRDLSDALARGEVVVVVATPAHRARLEAALAGAGLDVAEAVNEGRLRLADADATLRHIVRHDRVDEERFDSVLGTMVRDATEAARPVRVYGEMVACLWGAGKVPPAMELEARWNELGHRVAFSLLCAYQARSLAGGADRQRLGEVCRLHSSVIDIDAGWSEVRHFAASFRAPTAARLFVAATLERWGLGGLVDDAVLVVSELVTNAVVHARSDVVVTLSLAGEAVRLSVEDGSRMPPAPRPSPALDESGRGLALVAAAASRWGTDVGGDGKVVWVELHH
jgi:hypothetical protein